jgi:hypothetical protein
MVNEWKIGGGNFEPLDQRGGEPHGEESDTALSPIGYVASCQQTVW